METMTTFWRSAAKERPARSAMAIISSRSDTSSTDCMFAARPSPRSVVNRCEYWPIMPRPELDARSPVRQMLMECAAYYLGRELQDGKPVDAVARFHLGNGARVEQINWAADLSGKGFKQSFGLMVNYLYDLRKLDRHRHALAQGRVPVSDAVERLYF